MFTTETISLEQSDSVNPLVLDYLANKKSLKNFYSYFPDKKGFSEAITQKIFADLNRNLLSEILIKQSKLVNNTSTATAVNIEKLKHNNVFTITTGHQLCLFTGPLYFIYKLFSAINLAAELKIEFPDFDFVPVYWMASEDHDFEEVNNFNAFGKNFKWQSQQTGAVGDFNTNELNELFSSIKDVFGKTENAHNLITLFEKAYLKNNTLKDATRYFVNELFGAYGIVVVDGHDVEFKQQFKSVIEKDIFNTIPFNEVKQSTKELNEMGYATQVNPRQINCFYIDENLRARIEKTDNHYTVVGTDLSFTESELKNCIQQSPQKISPNVVLRPVYQQCILPNIAYVGGPGELAYWLQYKKMFDKLHIFFPILVPRNFITVIDATTKNKMAKLDFSPKDFFSDTQQLIKTYLVNTNTIFDLNKEKEELLKLYTTIIEKISGIDKTLNSASQAEYQKAHNGIEGLIGKANKAIKQRSETEINQITAIKLKISPNSIPQERIENFSSFYLKYGPLFFEQVKKIIKPLDFNHKLLIEDNL